MSFVDRLDGFQRRHRALGFPLAVIYKFTDDQGVYLAALMTYYGFLAIWPLLLLASSILGFVLQGDPELQEKILDSTLAQFPIIGDALSQQGGLQGSTTAVIIGSIGALYGAMGVGMAAQNAMNIAWAVPKNHRPNPILVRVRSLILIVTAGAGILVTTFVSTLGSDVDALNTEIGSTLKVILMLVTLAVNSCVFALLFWLATTHKHSLRRAFPGAVTTALLWQLLQIGGTAYVTNVIANSSITNQIFATVFGLFAYLFLGAMSVVIGVELNVVKAHRLYPRALLTPFTDNVNLTEADRRAYADYATAQSVKNFQEVDVRFEHDGQYRRAKKTAKENGESDFSDPEPPRVQHKTSGQPHDHY